MATETLAPPQEGKLPAQPDRPNKATSNWMSGLGELGEPAPSPQPTAEFDPPPRPEKPEAPAANAKPADASVPPKAASAAEAAASSEGEDKWPRSAVEWKKFRESRKEKETKYEETIKAREARIAELEKAATSQASTAELEALKKENEELSKRIQILDVTKHPRFEQYFSGKLGAQMELAKRIVGPELSARVEQALRSSDSPWRSSELEEIFGELTPTQQSRLGGVLNALEAIAAERQQEINDAQNNSQQIAAQREKTLKEQAAQLESLILATIREAGDPKEGIAPYQKRENDSTWNTEVDQRVNHARNILSGKGLKPKDIVQAAFYAAAIPTILKENLSLREQIEKLQGQVKSLSSATPKLEAAATASGTEPPGPKPWEVKPGSRPMDLSRNWAETMAKAMQGVSNE